MALLVALTTADAPLAHPSANAVVNTPVRWVPVPFTYFYDRSKSIVRSFIGHTVGGKTCQTPQGSTGIPQSEAGFERRVAVLLHCWV